MKNKRIIIHLSGNSCTGKTTIAKALSEEIEGIYIISYDKLKWQLTNYHRDKHKPLIKNLIMGFFKVVCKEELPILLDSFIENKKEYDHYSKIARKYNYRFVSFKLIAHKDILIKRFRKRIKLAKKHKNKISVTDEKLFLKNSLKNFYPKNALIIDTSKSSLKQTTNKIMRLINKS